MFIRKLLHVTTYMKNNNKRICIIHRTLQYIQQYHLHYATKYTKMECRSSSIKSVVGASVYRPELSSGENCEGSESKAAGYKMNFIQGVPQ